MYNPTNTLEYSKKNIHQLLLLSSYHTPYIQLLRALITYYSPFFNNTELSGKIVFILLTPRIIEYFLEKKLGGRTSGGKNKVKCKITHTWNKKEQEKNDISW